jgi:hypothetical protein
MTKTDKFPTRMLQERQVILRTLRDLLRSIGSANDAEDHGYNEDALRIREGSCEAIRGLITEHAFLAEIFPKLLWELDTRHILGFGWSELYDGVIDYLQTPEDGYKHS